MSKIFYDYIFELKKKEQEELKKKEQEELKKDIDIPKRKISIKNILSKQLIIYILIAIFLGSIIGLGLIINNKNCDTCNNELKNIKATLPQAISYIAQNVSYTLIGQIWEKTNNCNVIKISYGNTTRQLADIDCLSAIITMLNTTGAKK